MAVQSNERKLAELILYISQKSADDPNFGQTKLNKILFFTDFSAYGKWGHTVTGADYQHLPNGPTVYRMLPVQRELKADDSLAVQPVNYWGFNQNKPVNLREPDLNIFTGPEIALVDLWIDRLRSLTAAEVSKMSHNTAAWKTTEDGEMINPATVFISWGEPTAAEIRRGQEIAAHSDLLA